ncbi:MAG: hypothetical protein F6K54_28535 [Okeania sp. SIO3B5]|uniref:DUF6208 family protein n=1 Tax=Okeania sp. SIO3B5 TaxID=2607811 RepID=UPI001400E8D3|nr:DUF6208 family protein [Okeania sp. SIO3B5]NEO56676.1 hypothetical protein [Okeania sp. SIO3B5]
MKNREKFLAIELWWEIPLALLSFIFFKSVRFSLRTLVNIATNSNKKKVYKWLVFSAELLEKPLVLPSLLTTGPRWNPHAIAAGAGPFEIVESLAIEISSCVASAKSWSIGIYKFPEAKAVKYIASDGSNSQEQWHKLTLEPGKYTLGLRYYNWYNEVNLPAVKVDSNLIINAESVDGNNVNNYFQNLTARDNLFYRSLNYYIFTILVCQERLPQEWVRKEYLPVGDPNNEFIYGFIYKNYSLSLKLNSLLLANYDVYLTIYNRSSLPIIYSQINSEKYTSPVIETDGFYLLRLRSKSNLGNKLFERNWISTELLQQISGK